MTLIDVARSRVAHARRTFTVELFDGTAEADWPSIAAGPELSMHAFQSRDFLDVWMATIGQARDVRSCLVVVRDNDRRPVLYLPLAIETRFNARLLRFMDMGVADFNAPILLTDCNLTRQEFSAIWGETLSLLPKIDAIDLQKVSASVDGAANPLTYLDCSPYHSSGHAIRLSEPRETLYARPSISRMRAKLRRLRKKLKECGPVDFTTAPSGRAAEPVVGRLFDLKRQQYLRTTGKDFFGMPGIADFYRQMTASGRIGRISHLSALTCGSDVVSAHLGFVGRGQFHWVLPAFDMQYRRFAIGHMLLHHLIDHCFDGGYTTFDLGEGDHYYKTAWATHELALCSFERAMTPTGLLYLQMRRVRRLIDAARFHEWYWKSRARLSSVLGVANIEAPERAGLGEAAF